MQNIFFFFFFGGCLVCFLACLVVCIFIFGLLGCCLLGPFWCSFLSLITFRIHLLDEQLPQNLTKVFSVDKA